MSRHMIAAALLALTLAGGCATGPESLSRKQTSRMLAPTPVGAQIPATVPVAPIVDCNPKQSYRPRGPLPVPGAMPAETTMERIQKRGRMIVGVGPSAYRLSFRDPFDGQVKGFEADIAAEIASAIFGDRTRVQFRALNTVERIPAIRGTDDAGKPVEKVDIVLAAMTMTCERWTKIAFSAEYYPAGQRVLVNHDSTVTGINDLGGKKVCASASSTNIRTIAQAPARPVPVAAANTSDCLLMLQQGQVDAVSTGDVILAGLAAQDPGTKIVGPPFSDEPTGIGISQESVDLVRFVNAVLEKLLSNGTWTQLQRKWLADKIGEATPPTPEYKQE